MIIETSKILKSTCRLCDGCCGVLIHMQDGRPVKIEGNPEHPANKGALCIIGKAALEYLHHPDRLKYPLKRAGEKGEGKWRRISWDEALDTIASELNKTKEKYRAKSVTFMQGYYKAYLDSYLARFANVFGSPNITSMSSVCFHPRLRGSVFTYGFMPYPDYEYPPACIVMWGANISATVFPESLRINEAIKNGSKLIVIDPAETGYAQQADLWIKPRPSSDLALALGVINVIINENLWDTEFVENWCVGFDKLKDHVKDYTPERVAAITWVPADTIKELARLYANNRPAGIVCGNGIDNNINNFQFCRAAAIIRALTGNIGIPGGEIEWKTTEIVPYYSLELHKADSISPEVRATRIGVEEGILPNYFAALPQKVIKAMLTSKPYPVRSAFIQGGSLLHTLSNAREVYEALKSLDFMAVTDFFMTPTAELADVVLPVGTYLEIDNLEECFFMPVLGVIQKVAQVGECWSDLKILIELSKRMGLGGHFWENDKGALDFILKPIGLTFDEFKKVGHISGVKKYRGYLENGFNTPSGKVELYSSQLAEWGFDPLPTYHEPPESPLSEPELAREYPLVLTNMKVHNYIHSGGRQIKSLRVSHPAPLITINTETAGSLEIKDGDWVYIETKRGKIKHKARLSPNIDPRVVIGEHGWWFPEKDTDMHGWTESNLNILTDNNPPYARELGSVTLRGILCRVYKA